MIRSFAGGLIGREIERRHGRSGIRGAAIGVLAAAALRRMGPVGLVLGTAWAAKQALDRRREARRP